MKRPTPRPGAGRPPATTSQVYSTTLGRAKFPEFIQMSYGEKAVIGFDRYGHMVGAIVPFEAVKILAGMGDDLNPHLREQIRASALQLLAQTPSHTGLSSFAQGSQSKPAERSIVELEEIEARRLRRRVRPPAKAPRRKI